MIGPFVEVQPWEVGSTSMVWPWPKRSLTVSIFWEYPTSFQSQESQTLKVRLFWDMSPHFRPFVRVSDVIWLSYVGTQSDSVGPFLAQARSDLFHYCTDFCTTQYLFLLRWGRESRLGNWRDRILRASAISLKHARIKTRPYPRRSRLSIEGKKLQIQTCRRDFGFCTQDHIFPFQKHKCNDKF
jgi:hypothetical protein